MPFRVLYFAIYDACCFPSYLADLLMSSYKPIWPRLYSKCHNRPYATLIRCLWEMIEETIVN